MRLAAPFGILAIVAMARPAMATPSARLVYARSSSAASCPDETALRKAVAARFGYDPFFAWARQTVVVQIGHDGGRYVARVQIVDDEGLSRGTREITSDEENCSELFDAAALAISIALDASANTPAPPPPPAPPAGGDTSPASSAETSSFADTSSRAPPAAAPPTSEAPPAAADARPREAIATAASPGRYPVRLGLDGAALLGIGPNAASPGVIAFVDVGARPLSVGIELQADVLLPADVRLPQSYRSGKLQGALFTATIAPCDHFGLAVICVLAEAGWIEAQGGGVDHPASQAAPFVGAGGRVGAEVPMPGRFFLRIHGDAIAEITPPTFELDGQKASKPTGVAGLLGVGLGTRLP